MDHGNSEDDYDPDYGYDKHLADAYIEDANTDSEELIYRRSEQA